MKMAKSNKKTTNECEICIKMSDNMRIDFNKKQEKETCMKVKKRTKISQSYCCKISIRSEYDEAVKKKTK